MWPPLLLDGAAWLHFFAPLQSTSVSRKAAKEKAAMSINSKVRPKSALLVGLAFFMALVLEFDEGRKLNVTGG